MGYSALTVEPVDKILKGDHSSTGNKTKTDQISMLALIISLQFSFILNDGPGGHEGRP